MISKEERGAITKAFSNAVKKYVARELAKFKAELLEEVQQRAAIAYRGIWRVGQQYTQGEFVTDGGSVWHANKQTRGKPGTCPDWTLAVKRGSDGKDLR